MSILNAIISAIMSFFMLLFPWMGPADPVDPVDPVDPPAVVDPVDPPAEPIEPAIQVIEVSSITSSEEDAYKKGVGFIISDYNTWENYKPFENNDEVVAYDEEFFKDNSLAIVEVALPDSSCYVNFKDYSNVSGKVSVYFDVVGGVGMGATVICYNVIVVPVTKDCVEVAAVAQAVNLWECQSAYNVERKEPKVYSTYAEWSKTDIAKEMPYYTEEFFEQFSLAVVTASIKNGQYMVKAVSATENGNTVEVKYEVVFDDSKMGTMLNAYGAVLVPVSKNITEVTAIDASTDA